MNKILFRIVFLLSCALLGVLIGIGIVEFILH